MNIANFKENETHNTQELKEKKNNHRNKDDILSTNFKELQEKNKTLNNTIDKIEKEILTTKTIILDNNILKHELMKKIEDESKNKKDIMIEKIHLEKLLQDKDEEILNLKKENTELKYSNQNLDNNLAQIKNENEEKIKEISILTLKNEENKNSIGQLKNENESLTLQLNNLKEKNFELSEQIKSLNLKVAHLEYDISGMKMELSTKDNELQEVTKNQDNTQKQFDNLTNEFKELTQKNDIMKNDLIEKEKIINLIKTKNEQNEESLKELDSFNQKIRKERNHLQKNLQIFIDENKAAAEHIAKIENDLVEFNNKNRNLMIQIENIENENKELVAQIDEISRQKENSKIKNYINSLTNKNSQLEDQIQILLNKIEYLNSKNEKNINNQNFKNNYENMLYIEKEKNKNAGCVIDSLRKEIKFLKEENLKLSKQIFQINTNYNTTSSGEDNIYLKELITDLHNQIGTLSKELNGLKNKNNQRLSVQNSKSDEGINKTYTMINPSSSEY